MEPASENVLLVYYLATDTLLRDIHRVGIASISVLW